MKKSLTYDRRIDRARRNGTKDYWRVKVYAGTGYGASMNIGSARVQAAMGDISLVKRRGAISAGRQRSTK
jgi:hypothetical protein